MSGISFRRTTVVASGIALVASLAAATASTANATSTEDDVCVPSDAWTEEVDAQGEEFIISPNPDYVPPTEAWVEEIRTEVTTYQLYKWNGRGQPGSSTPETNRSAWQAVGEPITEAPAYDVGVVYWIPAENAYYYWVVDSTETIDIIDHPAVEAQGEQWIYEPNPEFVPAQRIEHPAVVCPEPEPEPSEPTHDKDKDEDKEKAEEKAEEKEPAAEEVSQDVTQEVSSDDATDAATTDTTGDSSSTSDEGSSSSTSSTSSTGDSSSASSSVVHVNG